MDYHCVIFDKHINSKSRAKHFKSKSHIELSKCDRAILSLNKSSSVDIDEIDEI